jgi:hypothetical protein
VAGLKSIARCTELRLLKMGYCLDITNAGLVYIGATCKNLREFDCYRFVSNCGRDSYLCRIKANSSYFKAH